MGRDWNEFERRIGMSGDICQLRGLRDEFHSSFDAACFPMEHKFMPERINDIHDSFIRKAVQLAEQQVGWKERGFAGSISYALILLGSGGRREQTMSSDQDNGIVYEHIASMTYEEAQSRMAELAQAINSHLEQIGYPPCDGNVLAGNSFWRRTAEEWKETFLHWAEERTFETVRNLLIVADARMICGNVDTAAHLTSAHSACIQSYHTVLLPRMLENTLRHKVLIGMFGNWLREPYGEDTGSIDIKYGAYLPMVNAIRLLALGEQIGAASTLERIRKLEEAGVVSTMTAEDWKHAFRTILEIRSMIPACTDKGYYYNRGKLPSAKLTKAVKKELRQALRIGASMQKCVRRTFARERRI